MEYVSFIVSVAVFAFVVRLMTFQKRYDLFNGMIITGALVVVLLDTDTLITGREYDIAGFLSLAVLLCWFLNLRRKPIDATIH